MSESSKRIKINPYQKSKLKYDIEQDEAKLAELSIAIADARQLQDLSENEEYHSAISERNSIIPQLQERRELYDNCEVVELTVGDSIVESGLVDIFIVHDDDSEEYIGPYVIGDDEFLLGFLDPKGALGKKIIGGVSGIYEVQSMTGDIIKYRVERLQPDDYPRFREHYKTHDFMEDISEWKAE